MAAMDVAMAGTSDLDFDLPARKKPKITELPLSSTQHDAIDGMLHTFKKKGEFDALRKKAFQQYNESAQRGMFEASLRNFSAAEIDRDSMKYLKQSQRLAAPLLEGAAARANVYGKTEADIDAYIDQFMATAERTLREIRRKDVGDEVADAEIRRGSKTEEEYADEAAKRRVSRARKNVEEERQRKRKEAQEKKKKELELLKKKQEALMKETEKLQREQKRRAEREAWKTAEKERERERIRLFNEERERQKKEAEEREKAAQDERDRRQRERAEREQKRLEAEALDLLLREGQEMANKGRRPELERSESMEPPHRLRNQRAPRDSQVKEAMRAQGLHPTSLTLRKTDKAGDTSGEKAASSGPPPSAPTGPKQDSRSRLRSPSPSRSTYGSRRRDPSLDDRNRPRDRRETLYRDISAERAAWKARQRPGTDRERDRDRGRDRRDSRRREDERDEGELVERRARSRTPITSNTYRPGARRDDSRSPPRRGYRDRSRTRSRSRRRRESRDRRRAERERERERGDDRSRSPIGIDRYIPGSGRTKENEDEAPRHKDESSRRKSAKEEDEAPRRRPRNDEDEAPRRRPRDEDDRRTRDDEAGKSPKRRPREDIDEDHLNSIIRDERNNTRRRPRYEDRDRPSRGSDIDRYIPGGASAQVDDERPRRRDRSRSRDRDRSYRERSRDRERDRDRERERDRDRDRSRQRERSPARERKREDSKDRRPSKASVGPSDVALAAAGESEAKE